MASLEARTGRPGGNLPAVWNHLPALVPTSPSTWPTGRAGV